MAGLSESITLSFMVVGLTKFSPDSCFGLLKQQFRRTRVDELGDIVEVVTKSASCNNVEVIGWEDGIPLIPTYDWSSYFAIHMRKIKEIKKFHHFTFDNTWRGDVICKEVSDGPEVTFTLPKDPLWAPSQHILPPIITPNGLDAKRQWYLYEKIRPFCSDRAKDTTCPLPMCPKPCSSTPGSPAPPPLPSFVPQSSPPSSPQPPRPKKQRICGNCKQLGHNARTCKRL